MKTTVYAIRNRKTKLRVTYRYRTYAELRKFESSYFYGNAAREFEVYRTTQNLPRY